jgi:hypothetical protein
MAMPDSAFASLGPSLLARKGGAKPAMRPQVAPLASSESPVSEDQLEDLGWNDMGDSYSEGGAEVVPIHGDIAAESFAAAAGPIVRRQQRRLEERVLADAAMTGHEDGEAEYDEAEEYAGAAFYGEAYDDEAEESEDEGDAGVYSPLATRSAPAPQQVTAPAPRRAAKTRMPAVQSGRRAAFTLRLDADRHLKLRLAATMQGVSAQALVTEALDHLLAEYDDLDMIANHLKRH